MTTKLNDAIHNDCLNAAEDVVADRLNNKHESPADNSLVDICIKTRFKLLCCRGKQIEATSRTIDISQQPDYFDEKRFKLAQAICLKYYTNISLASSAGLMLLLQFECILKPLLKSGRSQTIPDLYDRYTATASYIRKCYETDFYDSGSEGWRSITLVRAMHQRIFKIMNEDPSMKLELESQNVWVNQYDMALTQFAFIGLFLLQPKKCGAYHASANDLSNICYYWRLISYYFGIEEQFNLFVYHDEPVKQVTLLNLMLEHQKELLKVRRNEIGLGMAQGVLLAFEDLSSESTFNIMDHWWSPFVSLSGKSIDELDSYSFIEYLKLARLTLYFKVLSRNETFMRYMNQIYRRKFDKFCKNGPKIKKKLAKKYPNHIFDSKQTNVSCGID